jgi:hypothetical protein
MVPHTVEAQHEIDALLALLDDEYAKVRHELGVWGRSE